MSLKKRVQRNIEKQNMETLSQYSSFLKPDWKTKPQEDINLFASLARNGITIADLNREVEKTRVQVYERTALATMKITYSAIAIVLKEKFGFSNDDCFNALYMVDQKIAFAIDNDEIINEMQEKTRIVFEAQNGVERIKQI